MFYDSVNLLELLVKSKGVLTRECALPGRKVRSETMPNLYFLILDSVQFSTN